MYQVGVPVKGVRLYPARRLGLEYVASESLILSRLH